MTAASGGGGQGSNGKDAIRKEQERDGKMRHSLQCFVLSFE